MAGSSPSDGVGRLRIRYLSFMSIFESIVRLEDVPPPLSSTYFFVAASALDVGVPTFVSGEMEAVRWNPSPGAP